MLAEQQALDSAPCLPLVKDGFTSLSRHSHLKLLFIAQADFFFFLPFISRGNRRSNDDKLWISISRAQHFEFLGRCTMCAELLSALHTTCTFIL